ncbi:MAG: hypothetical protein P4L40_24385 [Terracidiphilus sp.]|nr:hypothetical protein [Terracidiphilus sp.]
MKTVPQQHTHFSLPVELQFRAIHTAWTAGETSDGQRALFPAVNQNEKIRLAKVRDPEDIRNQFFKMKDDEESALEFLDSVGVWFAVSDMRGRMDEIVDPRVRAMRFQGAFGHRYFNGRAGVVSVEYLVSERNYWRGLCRDREKLRAAFGAAPTDGDWFTLMSNTLPVHLEWRGKHPHAVIQPITGTELLTALAWMDIISGRESKPCQNCGNEYTGGGSKFCDALCERAHTKREYRRRVKQAEDIIRANRDLSTVKLLEKLAEAGIPRERNWVVKTKAKNTRKSAH